MEIGDSAELANELIMESAKEDGEGYERKPDWHGKLAAFTLVLALLTAVGALLAGITAHESLLDSSQESLDATIIEGDRVTIEILRAKHEILLSLGQTPDPAEVQRVEDYDAEIASLDTESEDEESAIATANSTHLILAVAVTLLSVGIAISGMAIIVDTRKLWFIGIGFGVVGTLGLIYGILKYFD